jgi:hypothetical protein
MPVRDDKLKMENDKWKMKSNDASKLSWVYLVISCTAAVIFAAVTQMAEQRPAAPPPQPIPFSHKFHAGEMGLKCAACHPNPNLGERMGIAALSICMECHSTTSSESEGPAIQKLLSFAKNKREIRWARVYQIPTYVRFSHRAHLAAGSTCEECHGPVKERDQLYRETDISMTGCMNCHTAKKASNDCLYCHEQQQQD